MMMFKLRGSQSRSTLLVLLSILFLSSTLEAVADEWLITPEEAKMQVRNGNYAIPVTATEGPGPVIVLKNPKMLQRLTSPIDIFIAFEPGMSGKPADMKSLKVTLIGFININITDRLIEYINGTSLDVEEANLPSGEHRLRMRIEDVDGNPNERDVVVTVMQK
jgi:hypothetical protein